MSGDGAARGAQTTAHGLFILGMHRSGTSAVSRAVNLLGVPLCRESDLVLDLRGNPTGHWESGTLVNLNNRLLHQMGHAWWCPPPADIPDAPLTLTTMPLPRARERFAAAHPTATWACKDPRTCLTLPFWLAALDMAPAAILVLRDPAEVAASLQRRNSFPPHWGLALWERYVRLALTHLAGLPVLISRYGELLADTKLWCARTRDSSAASASPPRRTARARWKRSYSRRCDTTTLVSRSRSAPRSAQSSGAVMALDGAHAEFRPPALPDEDPRVQALFEEIGRSHSLPRSRAASAAARRGRGRRTRHRGG